MTKNTDNSSDKHIDIFLTAENFEDTMNGLKGVYFRLYAKESKKPDGVRNQKKVKLFFDNYTNMVRVKRSIMPEDWVAMDAAIKKYNPELKEMVELELSEYATIR